MSVDPNDYRVRGSSGVERPEAAAAASGLVTARFEVVAGTVQLSGSDSHYIIWDAIPVWDNIGFSDPDFSTTGGLFPPSDMELAIHAFCYLAAPSCGAGTMGGALLDIETGGSGDALNFVDERQAVELYSDAGAKLAVSTGHRFYPSLTAAQFQVAVHTFNSDVEPWTIFEASLYIIKIKDL